MAGGRGAEIKAELDRSLADLSSSVLSDVTDRMQNAMIAVAEAPSLPERTWNPEQIKEARAELEPLLKPGELLKSGPLGQKWRHALAEITAGSRPLVDAISKRLEAGKAA